MSHYVTLSLPGQSNAHPPSSTEVLQFLLLHSSGETQTVEDTRGSHLCLVCIQLLQTLVQLHQLLTLGYGADEGKAFTIDFQQNNYLRDVRLLESLKLGYVLLSLFSLLSLGQFACIHFPSAIA